MQKIFKEKGLRGVMVKAAALAFEKEDEASWRTALFASRVVGKYERGATLGFADECGVSEDTIEDRAHSYALFERLCKLDDGQFRSFVFMCRRAPFIYISHFRVLHDCQTKFSLSDTDILDLLNQIFQAEGDLSSRKLSDRILTKYGEHLGWDYYAQRSMVEISKALQSPDFPRKNEIIGNGYKVEFKGGDKFLVVAESEKRAEIIARSEIERTLLLDSDISTEDEAKLRAKNAEILSIENVGKIISDSRQIISAAHSWIGDNA